MNGVLYYFSGTGNTKWVADIFKEKFNSKGINIDLLNIENIKNIDDIDKQGYDFQIIGMPVYAGMPPKMVMDFVNKFPNSENKMKTIIYSTQGSSRAAAIDYVRKVLGKKGYDIVIQGFIPMPNNYFFAFGKEPSKEKMVFMYSNARKKVIQVVDSFSNNLRQKESVTPLRVFFAKGIVKSFNNYLPRMSNNFSVTEACTRCGLCLRNCPKGNITFEDGKTIFHGKCMMCVRCIHICPSNAIRYKNKKINQTQREKIKVLNLT